MQEVLLSEGKEHPTRLRRGRRTEDGKTQGQDEQHGGWSAWVQGHGRCADRSGGEGVV